MSASENENSLLLHYNPAWSENDCGGYEWLVNAFASLADAIAKAREGDATADWSIQKEEEAGLLAEFTFSNGILTIKNYSETAFNVQELAGISGVKVVSDTALTLDSHDEITQEELPYPSDCGVSQFLVKNGDFISPKTLPAAIANIENQTTLDGGVQWFAGQYYGNGLGTVYTAALAAASGNVSIGKADAEGCADSLSASTVINGAAEQPISLASSNLLAAAIFGESVEIGSLKDASVTVSNLNASEGGISEIIGIYAQRASISTAEGTSISASLKDSSLTGDKASVIALLVENNSAIQDASQALCDLSIGGNVKASVEGSCLCSDALELMGICAKAGLQEETIHIDAAGSLSVTLKDSQTEEKRCVTANVAGIYASADAGDITLKHIGDIAVAVGDIPVNGTISGVNIARTSGDYSKSTAIATDVTLEGTISIAATGISQSEQLAIIGVSSECQGNANVVQTIHHVGGISMSLAEAEINSELQLTALSIEGDSATADVGDILVDISGTSLKVGEQSPWGIGQIKGATLETEEELDFAADDVTLSLASSQFLGNASNMEFELDGIEAEEAPCQASLEVRHLEISLSDSKISGWQSAKVVAISRDFDSQGKRGGNCSIKALNGVGIDINGGSYLEDVAIYGIQSESETDSADAGMTLEIDAAVNVSMTDSSLSLSENFYNNCINGNEAAIAAITLENASRSLGATASIGGDKVSLTLQKDTIQSASAYLFKIDGIFSSDEYASSRLTINADIGVSVLSSAKITGCICINGIDLEASVGCLLGGVSVNFTGNNSVNGLLSVCGINAEDSDLTVNGDTVLTVTSNDFAYPEDSEWEKTPTAWTRELDTYGQRVIFFRGVQAQDCDATAKGDVTIVFSQNTASNYDQVDLAAIYLEDCDRGSIQDAVISVSVDGSTFTDVDEFCASAILSPWGGVDIYNASVTATMANVSSDASASITGIEAASANIDDSHITVQAQITFKGSTDHELDVIGIEACGVRNLTLRDVEINVSASYSGSHVTSGIYGIYSDNALLCSMSDVEITVSSRNAAATKAAICGEGGVSWLDFYDVTVNGDIVLAGNNDTISISGASNVIDGDVSSVETFQFDDCQGFDGNCLLTVKAKPFANTDKLRFTHNFIDSLRDFYGEGEYTELAITNVAFTEGTISVDDEDGSTWCYEIGEFIDALGCRFFVKRGVLYVSTHKEDEQYTAPSEEDFIDGEGIQVNASWDDILQAAGEEGSLKVEGCLTVTGAGGQVCQLAIELQKDSKREVAIFGVADNAVASLTVGDASLATEQIEGAAMTGTPVIYDAQDNEGTATNVFFAQAISKNTWSSHYSAQNQGSISKDRTVLYEGTGEIVALKGKNKICDIFLGGNETILLLFDDANGDALFADDHYSQAPTTSLQDEARLKNITEIYAGAGDDIVDFTSHSVAYSGDRLTMHGGDGDDHLWGISCASNHLFGDNGNDSLTGGSCQDFLVGGGGDDIIHCAGSDGDADTVFFCQNWGKDTIVQLPGQTVRLVFDEGIDLAALQASASYDESSGITTYSLDANNQILVQGTREINFCSCEDYSHLREYGYFSACTSTTIYSQTN